MSLTWMAFVAGLIAIEKTLRWRRVATYGTAAALLTLGVLLLAAPHAVPTLSIPDGADVVEVPAVQSRDPRDAQALGDRDDGCIRRAQPAIRVPT